MTLADAEQLTQLNKLLVNFIEEMNLHINAQEKIIFGVMIMIYVLM